MVFHHVMLSLINRSLGTLSYLTVGHVITSLLASEILLVRSPILAQKNNVVILGMLVNDKRAVIGCRGQTTLLCDHKGLILDQIGHYTRTMGIVPRISVLGLLTFVCGSCRFHLLTSGG